jgi:hypothetical protein
MIAMRLFDVLPFTVLMHAIILGYADLTVYGNLIFVQTTTMFDLIVFVTHASS